MRFLFRWQHVAPNELRQGPDALEAVIAQLQGFEAPAAAWESEVLPVRLADYDFTWLDDLCLSGRVGLDAAHPSGDGARQGARRSDTDDAVVAFPASVRIALEPRRGVHTCAANQA